MFRISSYCRALASQFSGQSPFMSQFRNQPFEASRFLPIWKRGLTSLGGQLTPWNRTKRLVECDWSRQEKGDNQGAESKKTRGVFWCCVVLVLFSSNVVFAEEATDERHSSAPYISGDSFRFTANFVYDELSKDFDPKQVTEGSTIFLKTDYLEEFFNKVHPSIKSSYILITHNGDLPAPRNFSDKLDDEKIIAWFGQNVENCEHEKLHPIPIGIANPCWKHGNTEILAEAMKQSENTAKEITLYMNFRIFTYPDERTRVFNLFREKEYCIAMEGERNFFDYLLDLGKSKFVVCPRGNGLDTHRAWEALLMGAIPIIKREPSLVAMFEGLPVLFVDDWDEVKSWDKDFLNKKYEELFSQKWKTEKLYISYWLNKINSYR